MGDDKADPRVTVEGDGKNINVNQKQVRPMKKYLKKKNGFTLIEVVISMAIVAILSVGMYNAYLLLK